MKHIKKLNIDFNNWNNEYPILRRQHITIKLKDMKSIKIEAIKIMDYLNSIGEPVDFTSIKYYGNGLAYIKKYKKWKFVGLSKNPIITKNFLTFEDLKKLYK